MESGYAGGEDSQYAQIKARDKAKREAEREAFEEKRSQGFKLFKDMDVKDKKFAETKYEQVEKEDAVSKWAKGQQGGGFKLPWDNQSRGDMDEGRLRCGYDYYMHAVLWSFD